MDAPIERLSRRDQEPGRIRCSRIETDRVSRDREFGGDSEEFYSLIFLTICDSKAATDSNRAIFKLHWN
ncbi:MAG TPA: hypothetical protein PLL30_00010 [Candidatus Krumholzibacteria bacterium]|nr:hypothetical protein [Candidatus Krumholzibacteria bacterium]HPD70141.1 hypothetical protein [Candidatus Krumholzibacteria bacterium]HRY40159.1 hypothetical protein [Candidatus Krumholzibacteria bacterium]